MPPFPVRFGGPICLIIGIAGALAIGEAVSTGSGLSLNGVSSRFHCPSPASEAGITLDLFSVRSHWLAMAALEGVVALFAVLLSIATIATITGAGLSKRYGALIAILVIGAVAVARDAHMVWGMLEAGKVRGFLSHLLASLPSECINVRKAVMWARMLGEPAGIALGIAMSVTVVFSEVPTPFELARRNRMLGRLLYAASFLFVVGILMTRANISWILAQWDTRDPELGKSLDKVIDAGVLLSGVAYSAILVAFFAPVRWLLGRHIEKAMPGSDHPTRKAREQWLEDNDLAGRWQDDARQILAILAPVISVPVFEALAKL